jgi:hypothetical protein
VCDLHIRSAYNLSPNSIIRILIFFFFFGRGKVPGGGGGGGGGLDLLCPGHFVTFGSHCLFDYSAALSEKGQKGKNS